MANVVVLDRWLPSSSRAPKAHVNTIVLHATVSKNATSPIAWLRQIGLSYHYIVDRDGTIYKCVPTTRKAFHAGISEGPQGKWVNGYSIGIALVSMNDGSSYPVVQRNAAEWLVNELRKQFPLKYVATHYAIAPRRKSDPRNYPLDEFAQRTGLLKWKIGSLTSYVHP